MTDIITEFTIFFFFVRDLLHLIFKTSVHEDELDILFLSLALTDGVTFLIIGLSFCGKKSVMKELIKESVKESVKESSEKLSDLTSLTSSTVKDSISTSANVIFFSIEFSLISTLQETKIKLVFLSYRQ